MSSEKTTLFLRLWGHCWSHSAQTQEPPASGVTLILLGVSRLHLRPRCPPPVLEDCAMGGVEHLGIRDTEETQSQSAGTTAA